ncbi:MAG: N-acyl-D-amino-acid deacylase family protein [Limisphaerales bacterium]
MKNFCTILLLGSIFLTSHSRAFSAQYDVLIRNGTIYDGSGAPGFIGDVAIKNDKISAVGKIEKAFAENMIDAGGLAVAPGFINMLSWANESLLHDGRSQSDIRQGITLEILGEGESMGPLNEKMKRDMIAEQGDLKFDVKWTTLGEYLQHLEKRGVSCNVASFVGATTVRVHELGYDNRSPMPVELERMKKLVRDAMEEGALGVGSSLIYAPAFYAKTDELVELCKAAAPYGGIYISHLRSEGNRFIEALDELLKIAWTAKIPCEIYHLKAAGEQNWPKIEEAILKINNARADGLKITADMYNYTAAATGLDAMMPPWVQEGGYAKWVERLKNPSTREKVINEISATSDEWENFYLAAGSPEKILLVGFKNEKLKPLTGKTLAEIAKLRGKSPIETAIDLVIEDGSRVNTVYFLMSEENVRKQLKLPWISFGSDASPLAPEGAFLKMNPHPRAYGNVARLLGKYVRDEKLIPMEQAIYRLTGLPAENLKLDRRGELKIGNFADVVIFDPAKIQDHATFEKPHQYSTGVVHVFVNGKQVLKNGEHTGVKPGRFVRGPGWKKK